MSYLNSQLMTLMVLLASLVRGHLASGRLKGFEYQRAGFSAKQLICISICRELENL